MTVTYASDNRQFQGFSRTFAEVGEYFILSPSILGSKCVGTGKKKRRRTRRPLIHSSMISLITGKHRLFVPDGVQLHFVVLHQLAYLPDVKGRKSGTTTYQDRGTGLARNELSRTFYQKNKQQYYLSHYACCVCHLAV